MNDELTALKMLDEAIQSLKVVGYEFDCIYIADRNVFSTTKDYSKRAIEIRCEKNFPITETEEIKAIRNLSSFSGA